MTTAERETAPWLSHWPSGTLRCQECFTTAPDRSSGWRAYLFAAPVEAEDGALVIVYCPECAEREFGEEPG